MTYMAMVDPIAVGTLTADSPAAPAVLAERRGFLVEKKWLRTCDFFVRTGVSVYQETRAGF